MTDAEIKKALEDYAEKVNHAVYFQTNKLGAQELFEILTNALGLINRLEAEAEKYYNAAKIQQDVSMKRFFEIKRLTEENERLKKLLDDKCDRCIAKERAEAIKEFAEMLKEQGRPTLEYYKVVLESDIDNLVKEMVGDAE